jgi:hypothetical protein
VEFGDEVAQQVANGMDGESYMSDALFGFMNTVEGFQDLGDPDWTSVNDRNNTMDA